MTRGTVASILSLLCLACGRNEPANVPETRTPPPVSEEEAGDTFNPAQYWALKQVFTTLVVLPVLGPTEIAAQSENFYVLEMTRDGLTLIQQETYCWSSFQEVMGMSTWLLDGFYDATGVTERRAQLDTAEVGASYLAPDVLTVYGATLADPAGDALPTEPTDSRVEDFDHDGHPGFTAVVDGWLGYAESYLVQRTVTTMSGTVIRADRIEGSISNTLEQNILDASKWWAGLEGFESVPSGKPEENFFILQALDGPMTCAELEAAQADLFD